MDNDRRKYLKMTFGAGAIGLGTVLQARYGVCGTEETAPNASNGVVIGHSPKQEVLYRRTANWDLFYKSAY